MDYKDCYEDCNYPTVVVEENGRAFRLNNRGRGQIKKVQVDGCLIDDKRPRCDYLFEIGEECHCAIYVELKGADIEHAFNQLVATMTYLAAEHKDVLRVCHIVASRVPRAGPKVQALKVKMARRHRAILHVSTQQINVDIETPPYCKGTRT